MPEGQLETRTLETVRTGKVDWHAVLETALSSPGQLGQTYNRFHRYSFLNQVLLLSQGAKGPVASYKRWQSLGRQVRKGERGFEIVRPITVKARTENEDEEDKTFTRFKLVRGAFTYSQTDGAELLEPEVPSWDYYRALAKLAITEVDFDSLDGNSAGYAEGRTIAISSMAPYPVKTRFHELTHVLDGHTASDPSKEDMPTRGIKEFIAEGTAYLCMTELGLNEFFDASESRAYIAGWLDNEHPPASAISRVFKLTDQILRAGYPEEADYGG